MKAEKDGSIHNIERENGEIVCDSDQVQQIVNQHLTDTFTTRPELRLESTPAIDRDVDKIVQRQAIPFMEAVLRDSELPLTTKEKFAEILPYSGDYNLSDFMEHLFA